MSNYFFTGVNSDKVNLNQIYVNDGNTFTTGSYIGMPFNSGTYNTYSGMNPNPIGYQVNVIDIANSLTANYSLYTIGTTGINYDKTNSTYHGTVQSPSQCKSMRVISVGGGGGGGGNGGSGTISIVAGNSATGNGGTGGSGGAGGKAYVDKSGIINYNDNTNSKFSFDITIGSAGNDGNNGGSNSKSVGAGTASSNKGDNGNSGNSGTSSFIKLSTGDQIALAGGGNGGGGGEGGNAKSTKNSNTSSIKGSPGNAGNTGNSSGGNMYSFPTLSSANTTYGAGGSPSGNGTQGAVQIIWLYD